MSTKKLRDVAAYRIALREYPIEWSEEKSEDWGNIAEPENPQPSWGAVNHVDRMAVLNPKYHKNADGGLSIWLHEGLHILEPFLPKDLHHGTLNALSVLLAQMLIQSEMVVPSEITIAGRPLIPPADDGQEE